MPIIIFICILSLLILVHELGHYLAAKKAGIRVEEFGLGLPPRIFGKKYGETVYSLNALPFGGFVKLTGEDAVEEGSTEETKNNTEIIRTEEKIEINIEEGTAVISEKKEEIIIEQGNSDMPFLPSDPKSFSIKTPWQRAGVLIAGVSMNIILAVSIFYIFFLLNGFKTFYLPLLFDYKFKFGQVEEVNTLIGDIEEGSGAEESGLKIGEAIISIDGNKVNSVYEVRDQVSGKSDQEVELSLLDLTNPLSQSERVVRVKPITDKEGNSVLGVYLNKAVSIKYEKPLDKIFAGFMHSYNVLGYSFSTLGRIISLSVETKDISPVSQSVSGPVGIYEVIKSIMNYGGDAVWLTILDYIALMSLSLAVVNILPLPALDGGRVLFVLIEGIRGKRIDPNIEAKVHRIGMMFLLAFIILITLKDLFVR